MTKYARDEFDRVPETSARQGVHRAAVESRGGRRLGSILAAGAAALAVGLVAFLILPQLGFSSPGDTLAVSAGQGGSSAAASPAPTASTPTPSSPAPSTPTPSTPASVSPEATASAAATAAASATPSAAAVIDKTQPVAVFNGTTTAGLASRVGGTVSTAGWTVGTLGNWGGARQQRSVIFYSGAAQKGNADALGKLLGIPTVVDSADIQLPLVVVLGPGFQ